MVTIVEEKFKSIPKHTFKPFLNLTKADHLHESTHDEEFEYDDAYRLTQYWQFNDAPLETAVYWKQAEEWIRE